MTTNCDVAQALATEIRRRYNELAVLEQAYRVLTGEGRATGSSFEVVDEFTPERPALESPPVEDDVDADPREQSEPAPRRMNRRRPDPKSLAECTNGMQFLRAWAGLHGGTVNTTDAAGEMFKREDLRNGCANVQGLAKTLNARLSVYKDFKRIDAGLYRYDKHRPAEADAPRPPKEHCPRCQGDERLMYAQDGAGNKETVLRCYQCGHERSPEPAAMEAA